MKREQINSKMAPKALGPYSQAIKCGDFVFASGQVPIDPTTGNVANPNIKDQAKQSLDNLGAVLQEAGSSLKNAVKVNVYIKNMNDFADLNEVYENYFSKPYPARLCVEVARLPKDVLCEIEAIAVI